MRPEQRPRDAHLDPFASPMHAQSAGSQSPGVLSHWPSRSPAATKQTNGDTQLV
jgi:hypothetical protein